MEKLLENFDPPYYTATLNERQKGIKNKEKTGSSDELVTLAIRQNGFLGLNSFRNQKGTKETVSYWRSVEDIERWINTGEHNIFHRFGISFAKTFSLSISLIEKEIALKKDNQALKKNNSYVSTKINRISGCLS